MQRPIPFPRSARASLLSFLMVAVSVLAVLPAGAGIEEESTEFEIYVGGYLPGPGEISDELTYGFRFGYNFTQRLNLTAALGFARTDVDLDPPWPRARADFELTLVDVDALWNINPDSRWTAILFGGPGWSWVATDIGLGGAVDEGGLTFNGGAGLKITISPKIYLKVAGLARWFEQRETDAIDGELTLAAGFQLGG